MGLYDDKLARQLKTADDVTPEVVAVLADCAESAVGFNNSGKVDWERFYDSLEVAYGFELDEWDSPADRKIRRLTRQIMKDEGIGW